MTLLSLANHSDYANCISVSVSVKELIRWPQGAPFGVCLSFQGGLSSAFSNKYRFLLKGYFNFEVKTHCPYKLLLGLLSDLILRYSYTLILRHCVSGTFYYLRVNVGVKTE